MKKLLISLLCFSFVFCTACGGNTDSSVSDSAADSESARPASEDEPTDSADSTDSTDSADSDDDSLAGKAQEIVSALLQAPDPLAFIPEGMLPENMAYDALPVSDFTKDVSVSKIGVTGAGKQMNVLYDGLSIAQTVMTGMDVVFSAAAAIVEAYQQFIDENPEDYDLFTGTAGGFSVRISVSDTQSSLLAGNSAVSAELSAGAEGNRCRVQLTDGAALLCEYDDDSLTFGIKATVAGAGLVEQIRFERVGEITWGYLHEFLGTEGLNLINTCGVICFDENYTTVVSDKRETVDLLINGSMEVYESETGRYIGGEIAETVKVANYDTYWLPLGVVSGINSVRVSDEANDANPDTIFLNGSDVPLESKTVGGLGLTMLSRRFDVEMRDMNYFVRTTEDGKTKTEKTKTSVPMLFVQRDQTDDFSEDITEVNTSLFTVAPALPSYLPVLSGLFEELQPVFLEIKEEVTREEIIGYIGEPDEFFAQAEA